MTQELVEEYAQLIEPILPLAQKAYGTRTQNTPQHEASREVTRLLSEFYYEHRGSLPKLASRLQANYSGFRRRVVMKDVSVSDIHVKTKHDRQLVADAAERVRKAKTEGGDRYHEQLLAERRRGVSLTTLADELGLSSAAPLYYGVQIGLQQEAHKTKK